MKEIGKQVGTLGDFEQLVLLALLRLGDGTYGAEIRREIEERTGRDLAISAVYVTLSRLESKGLVESWTGEPKATRGGRRRKHLRVLPAGRRALGETIRQFQRMAEGLERELEAR
ncbi:MAG TPA: helix-turn-helix transcriptional regulator [Thermoanaerobaculia bacterium]|nr:helix-turn-helix transcriptional regulator [Thermoanaerobaculia bacterium]